jgi:release factor glutamine methyltransferase
MKVAEALRQARRALPASNDTSAGDARRLVAEAAGRPVTWVLAHPEAPMAEDQIAWLIRATARCAQGEPLAYILGWWEFYGRRFRVSPDVLIPRPETECLVERALGFLRGHPEAIEIVDVGTGSGCLAVTLAAEAPRVHVLAVDISAPALRVARANADTHRVASRLRWVQADLMTAFRGAWDLLVANLPYIPQERLGRLEVSRHEPHLALEGGRDGMELLRRLVGAIPDLLRPGGLAVLEIDEGQGDALRSLVQARLPSSEVAIEQDLAGRERILTIALQSRT